MCNLIDTHSHTHSSIYSPLEDQCEWHRMTRMTGPDCADMCNINKYTHAHTHMQTVMETGTNSGTRTSGGGERTNELKLETGTGVGTGRERERERR